MQERPKIGTAVWVRKEDFAWCSKRAIGHNARCPPGGHIEMNEAMLDCAIRETREEAAIEIQNVRFVRALDNIWPERGTHYVTLYSATDWKSGEPIPQPEESQR